MQAIQDAPATGIDEWRLSYVEIWPEFHMLANAHCAITNIVEWDNLFPSSSEIFVTFSTNSLS